jgi:hypothetical protein
MIGYNHRWKLFLLFMLVAFICSSCQKHEQALADFLDGKTGFLVSEYHWGITQDELFQRMPVVERNVANPDSENFDPLYYHPAPEEHPNVGHIYITSPEMRTFSDLKGAEFSQTWTIAPDGTLIEYRLTFTSRSTAAIHPTWQTMAEILYSLCPSSDKGDRTFLETIRSMTEEECKLLQTPDHTIVWYADDGTFCLLRYSYHTPSGQMSLSLLTGLTSQSQAISS